MAIYLRLSILDFIYYENMWIAKFWVECTVIRFVSISAKFCICAVVGLNRTLVEAIYAHSRVFQVSHLDPLNCKCQISTNCNETDYSVVADVKDGTLKEVLLLPNRGQRIEYAVADEHASHHVHTVRARHKTLHTKFLSVDIFINKRFF